MANLGGAVSNTFQIGQAELRIGAMSRAGSLTQVDSVGLLKSAAVNVAKTYVELKAGETNSRIHSSLTGYDLEVNAEVYEFTRNNLSLILNAAPLDTLTSTYGDGFTDKTLTTAVAIPEGSVGVANFRLENADAELIKILKEGKGRWVSVSDGNNNIGEAIATHARTKTDAYYAAPPAGSTQRSTAGSLVTTLGTVTGKPLTDIKRVDGKPIATYIASLVKVNEKVGNPFEGEKDGVEKSIAALTIAIAGIPTTPPSSSGAADIKYSPAVSEAYCLLFPISVTKQPANHADGRVASQLKTGAAATTLIGKTTFKFALSTAPSVLLTDLTTAVVRNVWYYQYVAAKAEVQESVSTTNSANLTTAKEVCTALLEALTAYSAAFTLIPEAFVADTNAITVRFQTPTKSEIALGSSTVGVKVVPQNKSSYGYSTADGYSSTEASVNKRITVSGLVGTNFTWEDNNSTPVFSDIFGIYEADTPATVRLVDISSAIAGSTGTEFTFNARKSNMGSEPKAGKHFMYRANPVALNAEQGSDYFTIDVLHKDPATKVIRGFRFWKVGIQGNLDFTFSADAYASIPLKFVVFEPTMEDTNIGGDLYAVADDVKKHKFGMYWGG